MSTGDVLIAATNGPETMKPAIPVLVLTLAATEVEAACRSLPPASERAGYWSYRIRHGQRCWFGPLKPHVRARARVTDGRAVIRHMRMPEIWPVMPAGKPVYDDEIMPAPEVTFEERFNAVRSKE